MEISHGLSRQIKISRKFPAQFISILVACYGLFIIADTLIVQIGSHHVTRLSYLLVELPLLVGISVIYLSTLLRRRKRTAWFVTILAYTFYLGVNISLLIDRDQSHRFVWSIVFRAILLPIIIIILLLIFRNDFFVRSDIQGFRYAVAFVIVMFALAILYGVAGFEILDKSDFHQSINVGSALHYTVDQFNLTTSKPIHPYTKRAHLFVDSLSFVSIVAVLYALFALFAPLRVRFADQTLPRERVKDLLTKYHENCEEFFKIWPHDKQYFFDKDSEAALAFHVMHGVALILSDPIGDISRFRTLIEDFSDQCMYNDWLPAFIHTSDKYLALYEELGFSSQKLGQEAIVDLNHFETEVKNKKYFRNIANKFSKQNYSFEILKPPHHEAVIERLRSVSDEWLKKGSRDERGYAMGYFTGEYMQMCSVAVARDAAGTIQVFANLLPVEFDKQEATYDMLRFSDNSLGNSVDYLLMNMIGALKERGYNNINLGLCPLAGIDEDDSDQQTIINNVLKFAYNNGDMFFSFSGLYRFKAKYEPHWHNKYVSYKGGVRGFSRTMTALTRCMTKVVKTKRIK